MGSPPLALCMVLCLRTLMQMLASYRAPGQEQRKTTAKGEVSGKRSGLPGLCDKTSPMANQNQPKTSPMANKTSPISELKICPSQTIYTAFKVQHHCQMYC